jgi:hypothetical protein
MTKNNFSYNPDVCMKNKDYEFQKTPEIGNKGEKFGKDRKVYDDEEVLLDLGNEISEQRVVFFVKELEGMEVIPISGGELCEMMHLRGINLRHLGNSKDYLKTI